MLASAKKYGKLLLIGLAVVLIVGVMFAGKKMTDYFSERPLMCGSCHIMESAVLKYFNSEHYNKEKNVPLAKCVDCHKDNIRGKLNKVIQTVVFGKEKIETTPNVLPDACLKCHDDADTAEHIQKELRGKFIKNREGECQECHNPKRILHRWVIPQD